MALLVNWERLRQRSADIRQAQQRLTAYGAMELDAFRQNTERVDAAKYQPLVGMETVIVICFHISSRLGIAPQSYADCFQALAQHDIITVELAKRLRESVRLRNWLAHRYWEITDQQVHEATQTQPTVWEEFL